MDWYEPLESISGVDEHDEEAWIAAGLVAIERYLGRHAAFDAWCDDHRRRYGRAPGRADDLDRTPWDPPPSVWDDRDDLGPPPER